MKKTVKHPAYSCELDGQMDFLTTYLPRIDSSLNVSDIQNDYTDGVIRGTIIEFKLEINDLNAVLFQTVKYLSSMRIKGRFIPKNILLVSLNARKAFLYNSSDFLAEIERVYIGAASENNKGFTISASAKVRAFDYSKPADEENMIAVLRREEYTRINIDENCIVGWATTYYSLYPDARKSDFIGDYTGKMHVVGEIRRPDKFKEYINPYKKRSNERFKYLMDMLNDFLQKKNLGAFYTPELYAKKSLELVRKAIKRVPEGNDYIILDRCAGTGNLERYMSEEELRHVIVSTVEYYEYKVLVETFGDKVLHIIPPTEKEDTFNRGLVRGADALSEEYINNAIIRQYTDNPNVTIILFENPPYAETTSLEHQRAGRAKESSGWKKSYVVQQMKKEVKGVATNDLGNAFIWSAFKYYLRQPTDSYIVYSPIKYWKAQHMIDHEFLGGFAFNRKHFHTKIDACIVVAYWGGAEAHNETLTCDGYDITKDNKLSDKTELPMKKIYALFSEKYYDKTLPDDATTDGILVGLDGLEIKQGRATVIEPIHSDETIGYLVAHSHGFDNPDAKSSLLVAGRYDAHGFFLRKDNYLEKLPMFAATRYISYNRAWTERARIMKSGDGADRFLADVKSGKAMPFLLKCLLFTVLEPQNHMREFTGSDGRRYTNHLCLDTTNGETIAVRDLRKMTMNETEKNLVSQWAQILADAKTTKDYDKAINYGLYQIKNELNTVSDDETTGVKVYDYPNLNGNINVLAKMVKEYYNEEIVPTLFRYEFLK